LLLVVVVVVVYHENESHRATRDATYKLREKLTSYAYVPESSPASALLCQVPDASWGAGYAVSEPVITADILGAELQPI